MRFLSSCFFLFLVVGVQQPLVTEELDGLLALLFVALFDVLNQLGRDWTMQRVCTDGVDVKRLEEFFDFHDNSLKASGGAVTAIAAGGAYHHATILNDRVACAVGPHCCCRGGESQSDDEFFHDDSLLKPQPHAVENAEWKEDCACQKEAPQAFAEAGEDVIQPCKEACQSDNPADN